MPVNLSEYLSNLFNCIKSEVNIIELFIIGKSTETLAENHEIDLVAIIDNTESKIEFVRKTSKVLIPEILGEKIFIHCFPISKREYEEESNMFIKNLKGYGKKIS